MSCRKMKRLSKAAGILSAFVAAGILLCGCAGADEEEIKSSAAALIEKSYAVNEIYFGCGLPVDEDATVPDLTNYLPADPECGYSSIDQLKAAASEVYTADYCEYLFTMAFEGLSADEENTIFARYIEAASGLTVRRDLKETGKKLGRTYDLSDITVVKCVRSRAEISVQSYVDGEKDQVVVLSLLRENGAWRLNSPTY